MGPALGAEVVRQFLRHSLEMMVMEPRRHNLGNTDAVLWKQLVMLGQPDSIHLSASWTL